MRPVVVDIGCATAHSLPAMLAFRAVLGAVASIGGATAAALAAEMSHPERRGSAMSTVMGGMTFAFVAGIPLGRVVGDIWGWRSTFVFAAVLAALAAGALGLLVPNAPVPTRAPEPPGAGRARTALRSWPLYLTTLTLFSATMTTSTYVALILREQIGVTGAAVGAFQARAAW